MSYSRLLVGVLATIVLIAGCAHKTGATGTNDSQFASETVASEAQWSGRISLQIQSEPPQAFYASFELKGSAAEGELTLISPIGSILAVMRWTPNDATLLQGSVARNFSSADELLMQATGAALPVSALFDWLGGKNSPASGWTADLSQLANRRLNAIRKLPEPQAELRMVLDR